MPTKIEWCDETLNPFWGCTHGCSYCQARRIAHMRAERIGKLRGYPASVITKMKRFEPVWLPDADRILGQVERWGKPRTIFIGFMGDIAFFYERKILYKIFQNYLQHRFLLCTKNPSHFHEAKFFDNFWFGTSVTDKTNAQNMHWVGGQPNSKRNCFISFEPLLDDVRPFKESNPDFFYHHENVKWFIIGVLTDRRGQPVPAEKGGTRLEWVLPIIERADKFNIPVFLKNNLLDLYPHLPKRQEFPWSK